VTQLTGRYKKTEHYVARHEDIIKSASAAIQSRNQPLKRVVSLISQARRIKLGPVKALPPGRGRTRTELVGGCQRNDPNELPMRRYSDVIYVHTYVHWFIAIWQRRLDIGPCCAGSRKSYRIVVTNVLQAYAPTNICRRLR